MQLKGGNPKPLTRLTAASLNPPFQWKNSNITFDQRIKESKNLGSHFKTASKEGLEIQKTAIAGLLWSKQYYNYEVKDGCCGTIKKCHPQKELEAWQKPRIGKLWETLIFLAMLGQMGICLVCKQWDTAFIGLALASWDSNFGQRTIVVITKEMVQWRPNGPDSALWMEF